MHLQIIEHGNQHILTTAQLAAAYGTDPRIISNNFMRNKDRYTPGKHYYVLPVVCGLGKGRHWLSVEADDHWVPQTRETSLCFLSEQGNSLVDKVPIVCVEIFRLRGGEL